MFLFRAVCGNHIIWGFQHVVGFRRRHIGASSKRAGRRRSTASVPPSTQTADDRAMLLRATSRELKPTRDAVIDAAVTRLDVSVKQLPRYHLAEAHETNPRSVWGHVQATRLSQRTPRQDGRYTLDPPPAAS